MEAQPAASGRGRARGLELSGKERGPRVRPPAAGQAHRLQLLLDVLLLGERRAVAEEDDLAANELALVLHVLPEPEPVGEVAIELVPQVAGAVAHEEVVHVQKDLFHNATVLPAPPPAWVQERPGEPASREPGGYCASPAQRRVVEAVDGNEQFQQRPWWGAESGARLHVDAAAAAPHRGALRERLLDVRDGPALPQGRAGTSSESPPEE
eukprot:12106203-Alexandrium_andersonii.AAC.1